MKTAESSVLFNFPFHSILGVLNEKHITVGLQFSFHKEAQDILHLLIQIKGISFVTGQCLFNVPDVTLFPWSDSVVI